MRLRRRKPKHYVPTLYDGFKFPFPKNYLSKKIKKPLIIDEDDNLQEINQSYSNRVQILNFY